MSRRSRVDWEAYKEQLIELRYVQGKSLNEINQVLHEKLGVSFTAARISQVFSNWKKEKQEDVANVEEVVNAN